MSLRLRLRQQPLIPVDVASLSLDAFAGLSTHAIEQVPLAIGSQRSDVGAWFDVAGRAGDRLVFEGDCSNLCRIGSGMAAGEVIVEGPAGDQLGRRMMGGTIRVRSNVGRLTASGMRGGRIEIDGDAGESLGGPLRGERTGMRGGRVVIRGNTAQGTGHRMRRGTILVNGCAGPQCGLEMVAGTIAAARVDGTDLGFAMRRGTIIICGNASASPFISDTPRFTPPTAASEVFLKLLLHDLATDLPIGHSSLGDRLTDRWQRSIGDLSAGGLGEVIW